MKNIVFVILFCMFYVHYAFASEKDDKFILYSNQTQGTQVHDWLEKVYRELFTRINIPLEIIYLPSARASRATDQGEIDGQFGRIFKYQEHHPRQKRVNFPIYKITVEAYALREANIKLQDGWNSLVGKGYLVDYRHGVLIAEKNLTKVVSSSKLSSVTRARQGFLKLTHHRTDIFIHTPFGYTSEFEDEIVRIARMDTANMYMYVNEKHQYLVSMIEKTLISMQKAGIIEEYCQEMYSSHNEFPCENILAKID